MDRCFDGFSGHCRGWVLVTSTRFGSETDSATRRYGFSVRLRRKSALSNSTPNSWVLDER